MAIGIFHYTREGLCYRADCLTMQYIEHNIINRGGWDTKGVTTVTNDINNSIIICNSSHLTSFAVLVDVSGSHQVLAMTVTVLHSCVY